MQNPLRDLTSVFALLFDCIRLSIVLLGVALWAITKELFSRVSGARRQAAWPEPWAASSYAQSSDSRLTVAP